MDVEKLVNLIVESAGCLAKAIELSKRDKKWWAFMHKECWRLILLSWRLREYLEETED